MVDGPSKQDWAVLGLKPGTRPAEVERAYQRRRTLYERETLATYTLLSDDERAQMLDRLDLAYCNILGKRPVQSPKAHGGSYASGTVAVRAAAKPAVAPPAPPPDRGQPVVEPAAVASRHDEPGPTPAAVQADELPAEPASQEPVADTPPAAEKPEPAEVPMRPSGPEPDRRKAPGAYLRHHRLCLELSVEDVAHETKIRAWQVDKIESESFEGLPAAVYVRGFVVQYARFLNLPQPEELAATYLLRMQSKPSKHGS